MAKFIREVVAKVFLGLLMISLFACQHAESGTPAIQNSAITIPLQQISLLSLREKYLKYEGPDNKGPYFRTLAMNIMFLEKNIDEFGVFLLLGPPDYWRTEGKCTELVYFSSNRAKDDEVLFITLNSEHTVETIGMNLATAFDRSGWNKFPYILNFSTGGIDVSP